MFIALCVFVSILLLVTLMPLSRHTHWIVRSTDFPRIQFALLAAILLGIEWLWLDLQHTQSLLLFVVTAACLVMQVTYILPYTLLWPHEVHTAVGYPPDRRLSILTSNVLTPNRNSAALIELVKRHQPDILVTLESDLWWQEQLQVLEADMPYTVKCPQDNLYGMHVYSRLPLIDEEICYFVEPDVPSIHAQAELRSGHRVRLHFLHPAPPSPSENSESAERDAELIIVARSVAESSQPVVVSGDLNDVAWSQTTVMFRKISGLLDPRIGRGVFNTFHAGFLFARWPLDHLFHSKHFQLEDVERLSGIGSDHFPLLTRLVFSPADGSDQQAASPSNAERAQAKAMAERKGVDKSEVPQPGERDG